MWFGWSSRVLLPESEDRRELVERELAVGRRIALRPVGAEQRLLGVALGRKIARREAALGRRHHPRERAADAEAAAERLAACSAPARGRSQMKLGAHRLVVRGERAGRPRRSSRAGAPRTPPRPRAGRTRSRSGCPSASGTFTMPAPSPQRSRPGACSRFGSASEAALRDRLRAPLDPLAALEDARGRAGASSAPGAGRARRARRRGSRARRPSRS